MGYLQNVRVYLSGPVENSDNPVTWRQEIAIRLSNMGMIIYDPMYKPKWVPQVGVIEGRLMKEEYIQGKSIENINHAIRKYCLNLVRHCDLIILRLDNTFTVGTFEEIALAKDKPIFLISKEIPSMWLVDQIKLYGDRKDLYYCPTMDDCVDKLTKIDNSTIGLDLYEWLFLNLKGDLNVSHNFQA